MPSACAPDCNTPYTKQEFAAGASSPKISSRSRHSRRTVAVLGAGPVARRRCAVFVDRDADLFPLHVRAHGTGGSHAPLLDQYWRVAISALVGATLIEHNALSRDVAEIVLFVKGFTLFYWAIATWRTPCCWCSASGAI